MPLKSKYILDLRTVRAMLDAAVSDASLRGLAVAVCVADDGGHPLGALRMDGVAPVSSYIAEEKARTAAVARRASKLFEDEINGGRYAFLSAPVKGALEGGVPVIADSHVIASVGVAGCRPEVSAAIANAAVQAATDSFSS